MRIVGPIVVMALATFLSFVTGCGANPSAPKSADSAAGDNRNLGHSAEVEAVPTRSDGAGETDPPATWRTARLRVRFTVSKYTFYRRQQGEWAATARLLRELRAIDGVVGARMEGKRLIVELTSGQRLEFDHAQLVQEPNFEYSL